MTTDGEDYTASKDK